jgi:hypothetical protein
MRSGRRKAQAASVRLRDVMFSISIYRQVSQDIRADYIAEPRGYPHRHEPVVPRRGFRPPIGVEDKPAEKTRKAGAAQAHGESPRGLQPKAIPAKAGSYIPGKYTPVGYSRRARGKGMRAIIPRRRS